jgi:hypothetical protein
MDKPWFLLNPNDHRDFWWLYTSITDTKKALITKELKNLLCHLIIKCYEGQNVYYRILSWFKNDPNRYLSILRNYENWFFNKNIEDMKEEEIVTSLQGIMFKVYECKYDNSDPNFVCKIFEKVDGYNIFF